MKSCRYKGTSRVFNIFFIYKKGFYVAFKYLLTSLNITTKVLLSIQWAFNQVPTLTLPSLKQLGHKAKLTSESLKVTHPGTMHVQCCLNASESKIKRYVFLFTYPKNQQITQQQQQQNQNPTSIIKALKIQATSYVPTYRDQKKKRIAI